MYKKNFYKEVRELKSSVLKNRNREEGEFWLELKNFLLECNYTSYKDAKELVSLYLEGYNDFSIASTIGVEEGTIRSHKRNLSNILYNMFGEDFFTLFENFSKNKLELKRRLSLVKHISSSRDYINSSFPLDIVSLIRGTVADEPSDISFDLADCRKEVRFLSRYNLKNIKRELDMLDKAKLGYLVGLLEGKKGLDNNLYDLFNSIEGGVLND